MVLKFKYVVYVFSINPYLKGQSRLIFMFPKVYPFEHAGCLGVSFP